MTLQERKQLREAATGARNVIHVDGEWISDSLDVKVKQGGHVAHVYPYAGGGAVALFISRASPAAVLSLLDEVEARDCCWHCRVVLAEIPRPRCEDCPTECDVENCDAEGCREPSRPERLERRG